MGDHKTMMTPQRWTFWKLYFLSLKFENHYAFLCPVRWVIYFASHMGIIVPIIFLPWDLSLCKNVNTFECGSWWLTLLTRVFFRHDGIFVGNHNTDARLLPWLAVFPSNIWQFNLGISSSHQKCLSCKYWMASQSCFKNCPLKINYQGGLAPIY